MTGWLRPALLLGAACVTLCGTLAPTVAPAEVTRQSEAGFVAGGELDIAGRSPAQSWAVLLQPALWWNPLHSWSGDAANLSLDARAGGCFCEALPAPHGMAGDAPHGSIEHMRVIAAMPPKLLRMSGALGPLQGEALTGTMTVELKPLAGGGTHPVWSYIVGGYSRLAMADVAPLVDKVLTEQFARLAALAPDAAAPAPAGKSARDDAEGR